MSAKKQDAVDVPLLDPGGTFRGVDLSMSALPREVELIRGAIAEAMRLPDPQRPGQTIGTAKTGIYAFYDFDGEPIYVGQTAEQFATRVGRHMTGMRSDAVAKYVLDPFEVYAIRMWSLPHIAEEFGKASARKNALNPYEWTVYSQLLGESRFGAVLNEGGITPTELQDLPEGVFAVIIPHSIFPDRAHPDIRIARRAMTVSLLAKNISERRVSKGLRRALVTQTRRLRDLTERRYVAVGGTLDDDDPSELLEDEE